MRVSLSPQTPGWETALEFLQLRAARELAGCPVSAPLGQSSLKEFDPSPAVLSGAF